METILIPTDFSSAASNATDYAAELAKYFGARLVLVHAYSIPPTSADAGFSLNIITAWQEEAKNKLKDVKKELLQKNGPALTIEYLTEVGPVYDVVKAASEKYQADLIVMGIVGEAGKIKEHIIGSSAVKVARYMDIPTFIIPENVKYSPIHKISFACDMEHTEETTLVLVAKTFTNMFDAELEIVNVEKPEEEVTNQKAGTNLFIERQLGTTNHKTVFITGNKVAKGLANYFNTHHTDVIMLNPKKHSIFHTLFKENVTNELAFHVHSPLLAIH
ncbi:MAG TPA: universal stress protein [Bacteroidia bacterium]|jgi:nucleotide-binding universal stress UspA family protein|nr:universal stress protein [Bacteroidia bacterium]